MRHLFFLVYALMALWLVAASILRVVLSLQAGVPLDPLPAITGALGLVALVMLVPRTIRRLRRWRRPEPPTLAEQLRRYTSRRSVKQ